jgi:two-component system sensor histidine kinase UhpB
MLRQYITRYRQDYGVSVDLTVSPELEGKRIGATVEAQLLPIIREALTNVRRHGGGCSARVNFASDNGRVQATVEDDGCGFNPEKLGNNQGFGIRSMRGRAESIGGFLEVSSAAGKGTRVTVRVPWRKEEP